MLIRNLQFFEQVDSEYDVQGGASVRGYAETGSYRRGGISAAGAVAGVKSKGNYNTYAVADTDVVATPKIAYGKAYYIGSAVDKNGNYDVGYDVSYSIS